jgi:hypothetical protein
VRLELAAVLAGAALLALTLVLVYRIVRRDRGVRITRLGVFVERERYEDEPEPEPPPVWPGSDDTVDLPPRR